MMPCDGSPRVIQMLGEIAVLSRAASIPYLRAQPFKTHQPRYTIAATVFTDFAQVVMDFAIAINAAALQPGMLDQTQQLCVDTPRRAAKLATGSFFSVT